MESNKRKTIGKIAALEKAQLLLIIFVFGQIKKQS